MKKIVLNYDEKINVMEIENFKKEVSLDLLDLRSLNPIRKHYIYPGVEVNFHNVLRLFIVDTEEKNTEYIQNESEALKYILNHVRTEDGKVIFRLAEIMSGIKYS